MSIDVPTLENAKPAEWKTAADDWLSLAKEAEQATDDLHQQGTGPLADSWQDQVGQSAGRKLSQQADILQSGADIMRGVAMVLDALSHTMGYAQSALTAARAMAAENSLRINDDGTVDEAGGMCTPDGSRAAAECAGLVREALREAEAADRRAAAELQKLGGDTCVTDPQQANNVIAADASHTELNTYADDIPKNAGPQVVADWWKALSPQQQRELELAAPVQLYDLNGLPDQVKRQLAGADGKYNRVESVRWAELHWNDDSQNIGGVDSNCTNFVSWALRNAGMHDKQDDSSDEWHPGVFSSTPIIGRYDKTRPAAWAAAQNQHDFMLRNGGSEVPLSQAQPGDIVYFQEDSSQNKGIQQGTIHHAALVTAVTPEGDIRYTQHSDDRANISLDERTNQELQAEGRQRIVVVRPSPNWY